MINELKELVKLNLNGKLSWKKYVEHGNHDHKFGPNVLDYIVQVPIVGILAYFFMFALIYSLIEVVRVVSTPSIIIKKLNKCNRVKTKSVA